jgi:hypothetical protein
MGTTTSLSTLGNIESDRRRYVWLARIDMWVSQVMLWVAVCSSAVVSVGLLADYLNPKAAGVISALPVVLAIVENTMAFSARSGIHWSRARRLKAIQREQATKPVADLVKALNDLDTEMDELWDKQVTNRGSLFFRSIQKREP